MSLDTDKFTEMVQQNNRRTKQVHRSKRLHKSTRLQALHKLSILGTGSFGNKVWLVRNKTTKQPFALKIINKKQSIVHCQVEGVKREKKIMASISHPFIVNLISTFQDSHNLYMLLQFIQGGELHSVIHQEHKDGIPNDHACFYAACILESLGYIHQHHITHRGIKPENILIDYMGYCILIDFGLAKVVHDKTYTLCGTVEYLAPEMILLKGHNKGVDYWAFGVLIYEMLVGHSPFYSEQSDQASQFTSIVNIQYSFPPGGIVNEHAQDLIRRIFVRHPHNRFGCLQRGYLDIREHPWFDGVDTVKLLEKRIVPPWIPEIRDEVDASHFCYYGDLEEEVSNKRLSTHQQELFEGF